MPTANKSQAGYKWLIQRQTFLICLLLAVSTLAVFLRVHSFEFVNYDDTDYITENQYVKAGLTSDGIVWALTAGHAANWHPLTWISHMRDSEVFGLNPAGHRMMSLF